MAKYYRILWTFLLFFILSCSAHNKPISSGLNGSGEGLSQPVFPSVYILGPGDEISIEIWRNDDLGRTVRIDPSGHIYLPLAGELAVSGLSVSQVREELTSRLSKYIINPQVNVSVTAFGSQKAYVLGEVNTPTALTIDRKILPLEAIAKAGGFKDSANASNVLLIRAVTGEIKIGTINLDIKKLAENGKIDQNGFLIGGDILYVPSSFIANLEKFMNRLSNILRPVTDLERGIVLSQDVIDTLQGERGDQNVIVAP